MTSFRSSVAPKGIGGILVSCSWIQVFATIGVFDLFRARQLLLPPPCIRLQYGVSYFAAGRLVEFSCGWALLFEAQQEKIIER